MSVEQNKQQMKLQGNEYADLQIICYNMQEYTRTLIATFNKADMMNI